MNNVLEMLEKSADKNPDKILFEDENTQITYKDFVIKAKQAATAIKNEFVSGKAVPIYMDKSVDTLIWMFGTIYAGSFYTIVDIAHPLTRIESILATLDVNKMLTSQVYVAKLEKAGYTGDYILSEDIATEEIDEEFINSIRTRHNALSPLYCNFTSGSTGIPKGVVVGHASVIDFITYFTELFNITENDIIGNQAPFDFDVSVKDIYTALKTGATLVIIPKELFINPAKLIDCLIDNKVTSLTWAVSALCFITTFHGFDYKVPTCVKRVLFSGEVMPSKHLSLWMESLPDAMFVNLYGPTEITCNCTYHILDKNKIYDKIPIGVPFNNEEVFLIDENNKKIDQDNQKGEICIRGTALALGYYNNLEQTNKVFCQNPLHNKYLDMIYKTGDIGYYEKGNLYFAGRKDFQIKHLGHRIELEEIDKRIGAIDGIKRVVTIYLKEKSKLCAFYIGDIDSKEIKQILKSELPVYMIPGKLIKLENLPLSKNGKIDRKKLEEYI